MGLFDFLKWPNNKKRQIHLYMQFDSDEPVSILENITDQVMFCIYVENDLEQSQIEFVDSKGKKFKLFLKDVTEEAGKG